MADLPLGRAQGLGGHGVAVRHTPGSQDVHGARHSGQRIAQLVGQHGQEVLSLLVGAAGRLDLVQSLLELGADGVLGLIAIKKAGGISLVQDPGEAKFGTMPATAIHEDDVDGVVSIADLITMLPELTRGHAIVGAPTGDQVLGAAPEAIRKLTDPAA
jgi:hypothetical protein